MIHRKNQCRTLIISRNTEIANYLILRMNSNLKSLKNLDAEIKTAITKKLQIHAFIFSIFILIQLKAQCLTNKSMRTAGLHEQHKRDDIFIDSSNQNMN